MEPSKAVASNGCDSANTSTVTVGKDCIEVLNEHQSTVETEKPENQCQMKTPTQEITTNPKEIIEANDLLVNIDEMHRSPTKDENDINTQSSVKVTVEELVKKDEMTSAREVPGINEMTSTANAKDETAPAADLLGKEKASTGGDTGKDETLIVGDVVEKDEVSTVGDVGKDEAATVGDMAKYEASTVGDMEKDEASTVGVDVGKDETSTVGDLLSKNETATVGDDLENNEPATAEDIREKGEGSPCSQEDMFASEPPSPGIIPCSIGNTLSSEQIEECAKDEKMEIDSSTDVLGDKRLSKRQHADTEDDSPEEQKNSDAEGNLPKRARHSVEIVFECPKSQEAHDVPVSSSMNRSEEFLDLTGGTEESVHLHYSPSPEYDIPETQFEPNLDPRAPSLATVVLGSDDDDSDDAAEATDRKAVTAPVTQASDIRCASPSKGSTSVAKDHISTSSLQHSSSPRQLKPAPDASSSTQVMSSNSDRVLEMNKDVLLRVQAVLHYREASKEVICYELTQCDIVEEATRASLAETSTVSPANDSKNTSPGSVTSGGPFPLALRASTISSSSSSSLTSAAHLALSNASKQTRIGVQVLNLDLVGSAIRKIGPEPVPVPAAVFLSRKLRTPAPSTTSNKTTSTSEDGINGEAESKETVPIDSAVSSLATLVPDTERGSTPRTTRKRGRARGASSQNRTRARGLAHTEESPQLAQPLTWGTEDASRFKGMLHPGATAFARWTDKRYYSAKLTEKQRDGRWQVAFDDGSAKTVKEEFVIPVETLTKGQLVYATLPDGSCADGIVSALFVQDNEEQYGVELDDGREVIVPRREIFLTEDQARLLLEGATVTLPAPSTPGRLADVDLNNLVTGKRIRTPTHNASGPATPRTPGPSGNACPNKVSRSSSPSDRGSVTGTTTDDTVSVGGVEPESEGCKLIPLVTGSSRGKGKVSAKGKGKALFATTNILQDSSELHEILGPIPPKGSKIFEGMIFLLTSVDAEPRKSYEKAHEICSDSEGEMEFSSYGFVKDRLRMQLEAGGGTVLESLDDVPEDRLRDTILIANRPCLTAKYIHCLAKAVKIITHDFIIQRTKGDTCTPNTFGLPLGWSLVDERYVGNAADLGALQRTRKGSSRQLLARKKLVLVHETPQFLAFWQKVLLDIGAKTTTFSPNDATKAEAELKSADAIVSDASCPPHIQERAREWRKPLISTTWITQCLINREVLPFDSFPNFMYDFCG